MSIQRTFPNSHHANIVLFDIDGCCIESDDRLPHLLAGDRDAYDNLHHTDSEIYAVSRLYHLLMTAPDLTCLFVTSRRECARDYTSRQLQVLFGDAFKPENLLMRRMADGETHDTILKPRLVEEHGVAIEDILFVIEDRDTMVSKWRELGVVVLQPRPGAF